MTTTNAPHRELVRQARLAQRRDTKMEHHGLTLTDTGEGFEVSGRHIETSTHRRRRHALKRIHNICRGTAKDRRKSR